MSQSPIHLLDGGMGRELKRSGAPFRQPEWSALALIESPEHVLQAHEAFIRAGARVVTTNSYAVVPFHLGQTRFAEQGRPDDNPDSFGVRLDAYNRNTAPLLPYYEAQGKLVELDGMGSIESVAAAVDAALAG